MKHYNNSIKIAQIKLCPYSPDSEFVQDFPRIEYFDDRNDFVLNMTQSGLAVLLTLYNNSYPQRGIRRWLSVTIINDMNKTALASSKVRVNMSKCISDSYCRVDLPFAYANVDHETTYRVVVRECSTGQLIGERTFCMYDERLLDTKSEDWYSVHSAGIIPVWDDALYKSIQIDEPSFVKVRFNLREHFAIIPDELPEVEIRVYFADGSKVQQFVKPVRRGFGWDDIYVEMSFFASFANKGVCYVELLVMETAVGGFAFSTAGPVVHGRYKSKETWILDEYTPESAAERLGKEIEDADMGTDTDTDTETDDVETENDGSDQLFSDKDFDEMLDEFIRSQMDELGDSEGNDEQSGEPGSEENEDERLEDSVVKTDDKPKSILVSLNGLTGLKSVKEKLAVYEKMVMFNKMRSDNGLPVGDTPLHAMFLGSPGTGKTTVAKRMGIMLHRAGLLSKGHVVVKERANLMGPYYSNEESKTLEAIEESQGGILFIDEAYQLYQPEDPRDPGKFVIETLMTALADERKRDWMLILGGYPDKMLKMFNMNPGLKSRIPESNIYTFDDFDPSELMEIAERYFAQNKFLLSNDAREALLERLSDDYANKTENFGNARHVINLIQTAIIPAMAVRVTASDDSGEEFLSMIQVDDIPRCATTAKKVSRHIGFC